MAPIPELCAICEREHDDWPLVARAVGSGMAPEVGYIGGVECLRTLMAIRAAWWVARALVAANEGDLDAMERAAEIAGGCTKAAEVMGRSAPALTAREIANENVGCQGPAWAASKR